jgi:hypothetical protein
LGKKDSADRLFCRLTPTVESFAFDNLKGESTKGLSPTVFFVESFAFDKKGKSTIFDMHGKFLKIFYPFHLLISSL